MSNVWFHNSLWSRGMNMNMKLFHQVQTFFEPLYILFCSTFVIVDKGCSYNHSNQKCSALETGNRWNLEQLVYKLEKIGTLHCHQEISEISWDQTLAGTLVHAGVLLVASTVKFLFLTSIALHLQTWLICVFMQHLLWCPQPIIKRYTQLYIRRVRLCNCHRQHVL